MQRNICSTTCDARTKFEGIEVSEATRLRTQEEENSRLKRLVADQAGQIHILKEVNEKSGEPLCKTTGGEDESRRRHWESGQGMSGAGTVAVKLISQLAIENGSGASARQCSSSARKSSLPILANYRVNAAPRFEANVKRVAPIRREGTTVSKRQCRRKRLAGLDGKAATDGSARASLRHGTCH